MSSISDRLKRNLSVKNFSKKNLKDNEKIEIPEEEQDALLVAAAEGQISDVKTFIKRGHNCNVQDSNGWTALHCAAMNGKLVVCKYLLGIPTIDVSVVTKEEATVFHYLVRMKDLQPPEEKLWFSVMEMLMKKGCNMNAVNKHGETPLHSACMRGNEMAVRFLLQNGANPDLVTNMGETGLHYAIRVPSFAIVQNLLETGANPLIKSAAGTPKDVAVEYNRMDILELLTNYTQKYLKQHKEGPEKKANDSGGSAAHMAMDKKPSLLSDLIDTSHHAPVRNMPKSSRGEREAGSLSSLVSFQADVEDEKMSSPHFEDENSSEGMSPRHLIFADRKRKNTYERGQEKEERKEKEKAKGDKKVSRIHSLKALPKEAFRDAAHFYTERTAKKHEKREEEHDRRDEKEEEFSHSEDERDSKDTDRRVNFGMDTDVDKKAEDEQHPPPDDEGHSRAMETEMVGDLGLKDGDNTVEKRGHMKRMAKLAKSLPNIRGSSDSHPLKSGPSSKDLLANTNPNPSFLSSSSSTPTPTPASTPASSSSVIPSSPLATKVPPSPLQTRVDHSEASFASSFARTASGVSSNLIPLYKDGALKKGYMNILRNHKWQRLWFVLKERSLIYYDTPNSTEEAGELDVTSAKITLNSVLKDKACSFELTVRNKTYILCPETAGDKDEWISILRRVSSYRHDADTEEPPPESGEGWEPMTSVSARTSTFLTQEILFPKTPLEHAKREELVQTQNNLSKLIYALQSSSKDSPEEKLTRLLLDPSSSAVLGLFSIATIENDEEEFAKALISFFDAFDGVQRLLQKFTSLEISASKDSTTLFREISMASRLVSTYFFMIGHDYLKEAVTPVIAAIVDHKDSLEVNPGRRSDVDVVGNMETLLGVAQSFLDCVFQSAAHVPVGVRQILSHIQCETSKVFPEMSDIVLGAFIFLRFYCPSLVSPVAYGMAEAGAVSSDHQRALILISKILQNLANHVEFDGSKEAYMIQCNAFILRNLDNLKKFLNELSNEEEIFKAMKLSAMKGVKIDKKEQRISSLLWILKYINSKQAIIAELMAVKL